MLIEQLKTFYDIVLAGSLKKVAEAKNEPLTKISRNLAALERDLSCLLIERKQGTGGLKLTYQGEILFDSIPNMLHSFDTTLALMKSNPDIPKGTINLSTTCAIIEDWLVEIMPEFIDNYPDIKLNLLKEDNLIEEQRRKTIISITPYNPDSIDLSQVPLLDYHVALWASPKYLERHGRPSKPADLKRHKFLVFATELDQMTYSYINWHIEKLNIPMTNLTCINSSKGLMRAAELGLGIISLSQEAIRANNYNLVRVLPNFHGPSITMCFSFPSYWESNKLLQLIGTYLQEKFKALNSIRKAMAKGSQVASAPTQNLYEKDSF